MWCVGVSLQNLLLLLLLVGFGVPCGYLWLGLFVFALVFIAEAVFKLLTLLPMCQVLLGLWLYTTTMHTFFFFFFDS